MEKNDTVVSKKGRMNKVSVVTDCLNLHDLANALMFHAVVTACV